VAAGGPQVAKNEGEEEKEIEGKAALKPHMKYVLEYGRGLGGWQGGGCRVWEN